MDKKSLRQQMMQKRLDLDRDRYVSKSSFIMKQLEEMELFKKAKTVAIYVSMKQEVETLSFIEKWCHDKHIGVPRVQGNTMEFYRIQSIKELEVGNFGVLEPSTNDTLDKQQIDIIIVPMLAFNEQKYRLGYGGGFYDRYLENYKGYTIGVAFAFQKVSYLPLESHDIPLNSIITE